MSAGRPDWGEMIRAKIEFDVQISKVLGLLAPDANGTLPDPTPGATDYAKARINLARRELDRFERAVKGGA